jgi:ribonuclease HI
MATFVCNTCSREFGVAESVLMKYPGWTPRTCLGCRDQSGKGRGSEESGRASKKRAPRERARASASQEENLTLAEVLERYRDGPQDGVFTDGASSPNPGPGGWGAVFVRGGEVVEHTFGHEPRTTNNRMELTALLAGCRLVPPKQPAVVWTDSQLCVNTINQWAPGWEKRNWRRKGGEIKNLDLVKALYAEVKARPELELRWIKAHSGNRWNEYADSLATAYRRDVL